MSALFSATLHFFASNVETMKFGVIYALYFLFQSQPAGWPTECIRVTREQWTSLFDFYIACGQRGLREHALVAYVFKQLKDELGAFAFVMNEQVADASIFEIREKEPANTLIDEFHDFHASLLADDATTTCDNDVLRELQALNREYERVKTQACATPAATRVTQQWLKQTLSVDETNLRQLQRVMLKSIFPPHQEAAFDAFPAAARRLWQDRADSGIRDVDVLYRVNDDLPASANPAQATTASSAPATATASAAQTPPPPPATPNTVQDPLTPAPPPETPPF
ncbi:hypothetical protein BC940DRAFT_303593 [Gongronella butleri]|nr:hypothetical protein BC940DRAFT_303593 [Gongronella butleri]